MPYRKAEREGEWCVYKADESEPMKCYPTEAEADKYLAALNINVMADEGKSLFDDDVVVAFGGAVKALGDGRLGGYLVHFGAPDEPDLDGEYFAKDTDYGPHTTTRVYYQHARDKKLKRRVLDDAAEIGMDDTGVWIEAQLALRDRYEKHIYAQAERGKMGWSSGTAPHLVEYQGTGKARHIVAWPLGLDASITPTPTEPRNAVVPLKSLSLAELDMGAEEPAEAGEKPAPVKATELATPHDTERNTTMPEDTKTAAPPMDIDAISAAIYAGITKRLADEPAYQKAFVQAPEGKDHPEEKSFGDYLVALQRGDTNRIEKVYKATKAALAEASGATGGYLVPAEYASGILQVAQNMSVVRRCNPTIINMTTREFNYPVLDYTGSTAGRLPPLGGVYATWTEEAAAKTETEPTFKSVKLIYHELSGYTLASNMIRQDAAGTLESLLRNLFAQAVAWHEDWAFLQGTGAGQPLGVFKTPGLKTEVAASATFVLSDAANMLADVIISRPQSVAWIIHPLVLPLLVALADGSGASNNVIWIENARDSIPANMKLLGYPVYVSQAMPVMPPSTSAATIGGVLFGDWSYYLVGDRSGLAIDFSEHYKFINNQGTWRFTKYVDGQSTMNAAMYLGDGATTVFPWTTLAGA